MPTGTGLHRAEGPAAPSYEQSVFINCPYDRDYADLFCAVILTTVAYGFEPRSAREAEHRSETRFVRITEALTNSKYSIHDLSRFTGEGVDNIARFNMPLELGIAMALKIERQATAGRPHNWLVLVPGSFEYQRFVSDLAGFDPRQHELSASSIIREVASWLQAQEDTDAPDLPALRVHHLYPAFMDDVRRLARAALGRSN
ncbi:MAG: hypothetical protein M3O35_03855 [Acidobacteriota bacterium]|nr:hypothetical protein [Acidobacteriota bacterium]